MIEWFDDLAAGMQFKTGETEIAALNIKRFTAEFGPRPMHLDEDTAAKAFQGPCGIGMTHSRNCNETVG